MKRRVSALVLGAAAALILGPSVEGAPTGQTASATDGTYAYGTTDRVILGGREVRIQAMFAVPTGTVTGSPPAAGVDLLRPWAAVTVVEQFGGALDTGSGCRRFFNPTAWSGGGRGSVTSSGRAGYGGVSVTVPCPGDPTFSSYTLRFEATDHGVFEYSRPEPDVQAFGWSGVSGTVNAGRRTAQPATITVCGTRPSGESECAVGMHAGALIVPSASFTVEGYAVS
jgi:hypothetical protein